MVEVENAAPHNRVLVQHWNLISWGYSNAPVVVSLDEDVTIEVTPAPDQAESQEFPCAECVVTVGFQLDDATREMFRYIAEKKLIPELAAQASVPEYVQLSNTGHVTNNYALLRSWLKPIHQDALTAMEDRLREVVLRTVQVALWRLTIDSIPKRDIRSSKPGRWSFDGETWYGFPSDLYASMRQIHAIPIPGQQESMISLLAAQDVQPPVSRELFRESQRISDDNHRSALLMAYTALETGIKEFIVWAAPDTAWLLQETQSPPVVKLINDYIPALLVAKGLRPTGNKPPPLIRKAIDDAMKIRNSIAHGASSAFRPMELERLQKAIDDYLWMLDVYRGQHWAKWRIRQEILLAWEPDLADLQVAP